MSPFTQKFSVVLFVIEYQISNSNFLCKNALNTNFLLYLKKVVFAVAEKISIFQEQGSQKSTQGIAETSLGVEEHSKESGSGVFARDSEVEREEL